MDLRRPALLAFGLAPAGILIPLAIFGFGDARDSAELQLAREADASARALQAEWRQRIASPDAPVGGELQRLTLPAPGTADRQTVAVCAALEADPLKADDGRLHLVAARGLASSGKLQDAVVKLRSAAEADPAIAGEALLALVHAHVRCERTDELGTTYLNLASDIPFDSAVQGVSGRILALLAAGPWLSTEQIDAELRELDDAIRSGNVTLPAPDDRATLSSTGIAFQQDARWQTLLDVGTERAPSELWPSVLRVRSRRYAAIEAAVSTRLASGDGLSPNWVASELDAGAWLFGRADGGVTDLVIASGDAIDRDLERTLAEDRGFVVTAFGEPRSEPSISEALPLAGTGVQLSVSHPDRDALLDPVLRRVLALRIGLGLLGLLLGASAIAGARAIARSRRLDALRTTFVASVSHDLRTPIASISLMAENMASGYAKGREEEYVDSIRRESSRLERLVDDLLDFGRIERGLPPRLRREPVDVAAWLDGFQSRERERCRAAGCALNLQSQALPESASLDAGALERAVSNLVDNALRHGAATEITLSVRGDAANHTVTFDVIDNGSGIARASLKKDLFEPFRRAGETSGTGLGLSIVRAIAEAHGGSAALAARTDTTGTRATIVVSHDVGEAA